MGYTKHTIWQLRFCTQCYSLTISWETYSIQCRGCIVFHCVEISCCFNQSCTDGDSSFCKFVLSICYVIDNCAEHCGSAVSRVEIFLCVKSIEPGAELPNRCAEAWNDEPGDADLVCPCSSWAVPKSGEEFDSVASSCPMLLWRGQWLMRQSVVFAGWEENEWPEHVLPHYIMVKRSRRCAQLSPAEVTMVASCDPELVRPIEGVCIPSAQEHVARFDEK